MKRNSFLDSITSMTSLLNFLEHMKLEQDNSIREMVSINA